MKSGENRQSKCSSKISNLPGEDIDHLVGLLEGVRLVPKMCGTEQNPVPRWVIQGQFERLGFGAIFSPCNQAHWAMSICLRENIVIFSSAGQMVAMKLDKNGDPDRSVPVYSSPAWSGYEAAMRVFLASKLGGNVVSENGRSVLEVAKEYVFRQKVAAKFAAFSITPPENAALGAGWTVDSVVGAGE